MREHKYQAWHKVENKMFDVLTIDLDPEFGGIWKWGKAYHDHDTGEQEADKDFIGWEHIELREYTGLKDKAGKEIFEGDIVEYLDLSLTVGWSDTLARPVLYPYTIEHHYDLNQAVAEECMVIGNVHENPELLKVEVN